MSRYPANIGWRAAALQNLRETWVAYLVAIPALLVVILLFSLFMVHAGQSADKAGGIMVLCGLAVPVLAAIQFFGETQQVRHRPTLEQSRAEDLARLADLRRRYPDA